MSAVSALRLAREHGVHIGVDGADLVLDAEREPPGEVLGAIRRDKPEIIALLLGQQDRRSGENTEIDFQERAAITEFEAGVPREWAEGFAALETAEPPASITSSRWLQIIDDALPDLLNHYVSAVLVSAISAMMCVGRITKPGPNWSLSKVRHRYL